MSSSFMPDNTPRLPFPDWMRGVQTRIEATLSRLLPPDEAIPARLHQAMRYASLGGGKRVRPLRIELCDPSPDDIALPMPDEREWKRALSRFRA